MTTADPRWLSRILPRVPEPVSTDFYRITGKLRVIAIVVLAITNVAGTANADLPAMDMDVFWRFQMWIIGIGAVDAALSVWIWKGRLGAIGLARLTTVCGVIDAGIQLLAVYMLGSVNSHMITMAVIVVMFYRLAFPFRIGLVVFGFVVVAHWTIVMLEINHVIRSQPVAVVPDAVYGMRDGQTGAMMLVTTAYALAFVLGHWAILRLRHSERAVRVLRDALHGGAGGKVGRHTGRLLRDTYQVGPLLAAGGMGEVYRGFHRRTGRAVAIKLLHPHLVDAPDVLQRFQREAEIAGKLGSPNIVQVIDVDKDDEQPFLVLELLEGEDLAARIERGPMEPAVVADVIDQVAAGLHQAWKAGVVHRDLKPENIFLVEKAGSGSEAGSVAKILDFGISKIQGAATRLTDEVALLGTPHYMAPEQAEGRVAQIDHGSDVFALGSIAYHALTGRLPFDGPSIPAVLLTICDRDPAPPSTVREGLTADVDAVLKVAMAKAASERYGDARDLARDLRAAVAGTLGEDVKARAGRVTRAVGGIVIGGAAREASAITETVDLQMGVAGTMRGE